MPYLLRLPVELQLSIVEELELHDNINLAFTSRYFRSIIKPPSHSKYLVAEADDWARSRGLFACSGCSCFRRFEEFADDMKKGKRTRGGTEAITRLCLQCGAACGIYAPGVPVIIYGKPQVLCRICGTFSNRASRQATCMRCSPGPHWHLSSPAESNNHYDTRERASSRSARVYSDRPSMDDIYGIWSDQ
jgi:hypothetical protein